MMCRTNEIINIGNKYRNNHNMRTSLVQCFEVKNILVREIYGSNPNYINDIYNYFATLQVRNGLNEYISKT